MTFEHILITSMLCGALVNLLGVIGAEKNKKIR